MSTKIYTAAEVLSRIFRLDKKSQEGTAAITPGVINGRTFSYEDASFVTGDSPATHDVNADLGRNGVDGYIVCDGSGDIKVEISDDGTTYGGQHTLKKGDVMDLAYLDIDSIKITWVSNSAYRILVI